MEEVWLKYKWKFFLKKRFGKVMVSYGYWSVLYIFVFFDFVICEMWFDFFFLFKVIIKFIEN